MSSDYSKNPIDISISDSRCSDPVNRLDGDSDNLQPLRSRRRAWLRRCMWLLPVAIIGAYFLCQGYKEWRQASARISSTCRLKQLALAMHNYHDTNGSLPAEAIRDEQGRPLLSWRVAILPFIEQKELYDQFKLDEPWDSPNNIKLLPRMPKTYEAVYGDDAGNAQHKTHYRVFHGKGTAFEGPKGLTLKDLTKGPSYVILVVEAADAVPWTQPDELEYADDKPLPKLAASWCSKGSFLAGMGDGSVRPFSPNVSEQTLRACIVRNDGVVPIFEN